MCSLTGSGERERGLLVWSWSVEKTGSILLATKSFPKLGRSSPSILHCNIAPFVAFFAIDIYFAQA